MIKLKSIILLGLMFICSFEVYSQTWTKEIPTYDFSPIPVDSKELDDGRLLLGIKNLESGDLDVSSGTSLYLLNDTGGLLDSLYFRPNSNFSHIQISNLFEATSSSFYMGANTINTSTGKAEIWLYEIDYNLNLLDSTLLKGNSTDNFIFPYLEKNSSDLIYGLSSAKYDSSFISGTDTVPFNYYKSYVGIWDSNGGIVEDTIFNQILGSSPLYRMIIEVDNNFYHVYHLGAFSLIDNNLSISFHIPNTIFPGDPFTSPVALDKVRFINDSIYILSEGGRVFERAGMFKVGTDTQFIEKHYYNPSLPNGTGDLTDNVDTNFYHYSAFDFIDTTNIYLGGAFNADIQINYSGDTWFYLYNLNSDGSINWRKQYLPNDNKNYLLHDLIATQDGGALLIGTKHDYQNNSNFRDVFLIKIDSQGNFVGTDEITVLDGSIYAYPNPSSGTFNLQGISGSYDLELMAIDGKLVASHQNVNRDISLHHLPSGAYLYKAYQNNKLVSIGKWVKN